MPKRQDIKKIMIIGSGPIVIGQACEFDYSGTQACKALRQLGYKIVLANSEDRFNPDCPPRLGRRASGRSALTISIMVWRFKGSM